MFDISGKVALVSGGASGIGLATVELLLQNGIKGVAVVDINETNGNKIVENLNKKYGNNKALFIKVDVTSRKEFEDAFKATVSTFENLDIVVNCAGIAKDLLWEKEIAVNVGGSITGTYFAFEEYLPKYKSGSEGVIVNLSSTTALDVFALVPVYSATKAAILTFSRSYGTPVHYERKKVRVMAACPGYTDTALHDISNEKLLGPEFFKITELDELVIQTPEYVAETIIKMIKEGKNGSAWVVENFKEPYELKFPKRETNNV